MKWFIGKNQIGMLLAGVSIILLGTLISGYYREFVKNNCLQFPIIEQPSLGQNIDGIQLRYCLETIPSRLSIVLFSILISLLPLFFLRQEIFRVWRWWILVYWPLPLFIIYNAPDHDLYTGLTNELFTWVFSSAFIAFSYLFFIVQTMRLRKK